MYVEYLRNQEWALHLTPQLYSLLRRTVNCTVYFMTKSAVSNALLTSKKIPLTFFPPNLNQCKYYLQSFESC